jgi:hypothetical protein
MILIRQTHPEPRHRGEGSFEAENKELQKNEIQQNIITSKDSSVVRLPQNELWSVLEGMNTRVLADNGAKFFHYHLLTFFSLI